MPGLKNISDQVTIGGGGGEGSVIKADEIIEIFFVAALNFVRICQSRDNFCSRRNSKKKKKKMKTKKKSINNLLQQNYTYTLAIRRYVVYIQILLRHRDNWILKVREGQHAKII